MTYVFIGLFGVLFLALTIKNFTSNAKNNKQRLLSEAAFKKEKEYYEYLFFASPEELSGMPDNIIIGKDGYPKERGAEGWGDSFTFYHSPGRPVYHKRQNCSWPYLIPIHAWTAYNDGLRPCEKCGTPLPDFSWFVQYRNIKLIMTHFGIVPKQRMSK